MFKEPGESSPQRVVEKIDRAAASSRSRIRRERTVRDFDTRRRFGERNESQVLDRPARDPVVGPRSRNRVRVRQDDGTERILEENTSQDGRRWSAIIDSVRYGDGEAAENSRRRQAGEELLRDALEYQRPNQRMRVPRSPRTSALRFEVGPTSRSSPSPERSAEEQALLARPYMPSPPYSFSDNSATGLRLTGSDGHFEIGIAEPTPGFAPAWGVYRDNGEQEQVTRGSAPRHHTPPGEASWTASYPPLRRVGHLSPRPESQLSSHGGLGDRRRSISSSSSDAGHDTWETLLTTMEPDTNLPSTDSSFTSATATQSTRLSRQSSVTQDTSFASTTTPTERHLSRATSPTSRHLTPLNGVREMDMDIRSPQYDRLSEESRASMRTMLAVIQNSRQFRASNPFADAAERRRQSNENMMIANHFNTLRMMDGLRSSSAIHTRRMSGTERSSSHRHAQLHSDDRDQRVAHDLLRTIGLQTHHMAQEIEHGRNEDTPHNSRQDIPSTAGRGSARAADELERHQFFVTLSEDGLPHYHDTTDTDRDLENMQRFIERMARREDIPDEWWAAAGLARTIRESQ